MYKITNPYEEVLPLLNESDRHYKTNLHTHSTYSDANFTMTKMIEGFYDNDFDILAMAEHGLLGKEWDQDPTIVPLFLFQNLWHGKREHPTTEQYHAIVNGTHKTEKNSRTKKRGLMCVPGAIEANMFTIVKNHVNGYFTDNKLEGLCGKENDYEIPIRTIEQSGGVSHINHPTDWLQGRKHPENARKPENVRFFADLLRRYPSCLGIEALNMVDGPNRSDRILWDELLKTLIPEGKRNVWGFGNSDAHRVREIDTAFMDFILPEYSLERLRTAMEKGHFFATARYAKNEMGENFVGEGPYPMVMHIETGDDTITVSGINTKAIEWIADGKVIQADTEQADGEMTSTIKLTDYQDKISSYVRCQLKGRGGICMTQAFICDDGNMARFIDKSPEPPKPQGRKEVLKKKFFDTRVGVVIDRAFIHK